MRKLASTAIIAACLLQGYALAASDSPQIDLPKLAPAAETDSTIQTAQERQLIKDIHSAGKHRKLDKATAAATPGASSGGGGGDSSEENTPESTDDKQADTKKTEDKFDNTHGPILPPDTKLPVDDRIKLLMYDPSDVYTITTRYGYQTNIVFSTKEEIETISVGDRSLWQIIPSGNRLFIRPMEEDVITNMTVLTNIRSYQFDLKSVSPDKTDGVIYVAEFVYKDDKNDKQKPKHDGDMMASGMIAPPQSIAQSLASPPPQSPAPPQEATLPVTRVQPFQPPQSPAPAPTPTPTVAEAPRPGMPNYSYTYAGPDELAPLQVYDDGKSTYLKYRDIHQPLPNIFVLSPNGSESPVTYNVRGDYVIVNTVAGELVLKNSDGTVHVFNEMLNPG